VIAGRAAMWSTYAPTAWRIWSAQSASGSTAAVIRAISASLFARSSSTKHSSLVSNRA
jgi:hypothetical protein